MTDELYDLPDGWKWTTIAEACRVNPTMQWPEGFTNNKPVHFVPMSAVDGETGTIVTPEPRPIAEVWKGYKRFQDGDVIFARITPCMENGKAAIAKNLLNGIGLGSTEFHVLRPSEKISAEWIYHFVRRQMFRNDAARAMTGTAGQLRVPADFVKQSAIPLPPLLEQRRIVARIESLFAESRTARDALERVPALLKRFRQSVLASAFRGNLTEHDPNDEPASALLERAERVGATLRGRPVRGRAEQGQPHRVAPTPPPSVTSNLPDLPEGWVWTDLGDLLSFVGSGITPKGGQKIYLTSGIPFIRSQNVYSDGLRLDDVAYVSSKLHQEMSRTHLQANDVLLNITGASIGRSTVVPASLGQANVNQHVCILRTLPILDSNYLSRFLNSPFGQDQIMESQSGVTRQGLNYTQIRALFIPLASLAEQRRIVAKIESLFAQADVIERAIALAQKRAKKVDQAILARAFRGELERRPWGLPDKEVAMPRGTWGFSPDSGGVKIPPAVQERTEHRIRRYAEKHYAGRYARLDIRFRGHFCYVDAYTEPDIPKGWPPKDGGETREEMIERLRNTPTHLCRLRYFGDEERWGFGFYTYSHDKYELCTFPNGEFFGKPEAAFGASTMYLQ